MKLIIDISEEAKRHIDTFKGKFLCGDGFDLIEAIQNGTPLDDVKVKIKETSIKYGGQTYDGLCIALKILDNISKESEETQKLADVGLLNQSLEDVIDCS